MAVMAFPDRGDSERKPLIASATLIRFPTFRFTPSLARREQWGDGLLPTRGPELVGFSEPDLLWVNGDNHWDCHHLVVVGILGEDHFSNINPRGQTCAINRYRDHLRRGAAGYA